MFTPWEYTKTLRWTYGYIVVSLPEHPKAMNGRYVFEHRIVMENFLGRLLESDEHVHHINENRSDNRVENLQVMKVSDHVKLHNGESKLVKMCCVTCNKVFYILECKHKDFSSNSETRLRKFHACSRSCQVTFQQKIRFKGFTEEVITKINRNTLEPPRLYDFTKDVSEAGNFIDWEKLP